MIGHTVHLAMILEVRCPRSGAQCTEARQRNLKAAGALAQYVTLLAVLQAESGPAVHTVQWLSQSSMSASLHKLQSCAARLSNDVLRSYSSKPAASSSGGIKGAAAEEAGATHTQWGSPVFRAVNFELYTKPEGRNKTAAYVGSSIFLGIMAYFTWMGSDSQPAAQSTPHAQTPHPG